MNKKVKILSTGDSPLISTGYGKVWDNLLRRLKEKRPEWEIYHIGWQNLERKHQRKEGYYMLPTGNLEHGIDVIPKYILDIKPDIFISLADVGYQSGYIEPISKCKVKGWIGKWFAYTPIDSDGWAVTWNEIFSYPEKNIAMSLFGYNKMKEKKVENVELIEHGVDLETFFPFDEDKINIEKNKKNLLNKFVIGFVGRNQKRKMIDRLLLSFKNFSDKHKDSLLVLHTDVEPPKDSYGWSLPYLTSLYHLDDKIILSKNNIDVRIRQDIDDKEMNYIYNLMDVFLYTTGGEGFGLPAIECQASGVPLLMTDCTTANELCDEDKRIKILKDSYGREMVDIGANGIYFKYPDDIDAANKLEEIYNLWKNNREKYLEERIKARKKAEEYSWDKITEKWINLIEKSII